MGALGGLRDQLDHYTTAELEALYRHKTERLSLVTNDLAREVITMARERVAKEIARRTARM